MREQFALGGGVNKTMRVANDFLNVPVCRAGGGVDVQRIAATLMGLTDDGTSQGVGAGALGSDGDGTLCDDRKRELITGGALWLIGDNLQHSAGRRVWVIPRGAK